MIFRCLSLFVIIKTVHITLKFVLQFINFLIHAFFMYMLCKFFAPIVSRRSRKLCFWICKWWSIWGESCITTWILLCGESSSLFSKQFQ